MKTNRSLLSLFIMVHLLIIVVINLTVIQSFKKDFVLDPLSLSVLETIDHVPQNIPTKVLQIINAYSHISGVTIYGFFAINPAYEYSILFELEDQTGSITTVPYKLTSPMSYQRMKSGSHCFANQQDELFKELLAKSIATRIEAIYEPLNSIKVFSVSDVMPSMKLFRNGTSPYFRLNEEFVFSINNDHYETYSENIEQPME